LAGCQGRERVREADKIFRTASSDRLAQLQEELDEIKKALVEKKDLHLLPQLDLLTRKMAQSRDTLSFSSYGYSGAFDLAHVGKPELERMYRFDLSLAERMENLAGAVEAFSARASQEGVCTEAIQELEKALQDFMDHLAKRAQAQRE
jgi:hypothetical protein